MWWKYSSFYTIYILGIYLQINTLAILSISGTNQKCRFIYQIWLSNKESLLWVVASIPLGYGGSLDWQTLPPIDYNYFFYFLCIIKTLKRNNNIHFKSMYSLLVVWLILKVLKVNGWMGKNINSKYFSSRFDLKEFMI